MSELWNDVNCGELKAELHALRKKLEDLETRQAAVNDVTRRKAQRKFRKWPIIASISLAAVLAGSGLLWSDDIKALFIDNNGNVRINGAVGINTNPISNQHLLITPKEGNIPFNVTDPGQTVNWLSVFKDGQVQMNGGNVTIANNLQMGSGTITKKLDIGTGTGTSDPQTKLQVFGDALINGRLSSKGRYQKDDEPESTYEIPPPYHLFLTAAYAGKTKTIPQDVLESLCSTPGGCEVRLGMTRWDYDTQTEVASRVFWFYYSKTDAHWRTSEDKFATAGDGKTVHAKEIWETCYFTDGNYSNYQDLGSKDKGMKLLLWNGYKGSSRTCELTISK